MDFKSIEVFEDRVVIKEAKNFELPHVFDCGQCFRWDRQSNGSYIGVAFNRVIEVEKCGDDVILYNCSEKDFYDIWLEYFDLNRNYDEIKSELSKDELLGKSVDFGYGIRILKQDPFEITLSFIISANNRIPMIKRAIKNISVKWGEPMEYKGNIYYSFPRVEVLKEVTQEELEACGVGFRGKYIKDTVDKIYQCNKYIEENAHKDSQAIQGEEIFKYDLKGIKASGDDECHCRLQDFSGIGPKVADCIMLFSMQKYSAFPVDVWVKRAMQYFYLAPDVSLKKIRDFGRNKFGELSGFAQQYLFYYARENNINVESETK